jgi:hypothetical protein
MPHSEGPQYLKYKPRLISEELQQQSRNVLRYRLQDCDICSKKYSSAGHYKRHLRLFHGGKAVPEMAKSDHCVKAFPNETAAVEQQTPVQVWHFFHRGYFGKII